MEKKSKIEKIITKKIRPFTLNEKDKSVIATLEQNYPYDLLVKCIDIGVEKYFNYDNEQLTKESVRTFLKMLGGIAYNQSLPPIEQAIGHISNFGKKNVKSWSVQEADELLRKYVEGLKSLNWPDEIIVDDLQNDTFRMTKNSLVWSTWSETIKDWNHYIGDLIKYDNTTINQLGTILPEELFAGLPTNFCSMCKQINASYENNLYDCTALMMRRLLEGLLVLSYQRADIEDEIMDKEGKRHLSLNDMIKKAVKNSKLALSSNTKTDMGIFKDLGNYSAHKIWYNCTQGDLKPHIVKYRVIIEELMYKSKIKK